IRVALALQHYERATEGEDQCCAYPTRLSLAGRLGLEGKPEHQRRTITKHLTALEKAGLIVKIREGVRPSYEYPKGQSAKWRLATTVEDKKRLDSMWDEPASPDEVGGQTEHEGAQDEGVGGQTEQVTRSVDPQKPVQFAHPTTPDYQPLTNQPLTVGVDFSEKRESEKIARPNRVKHTAHGEGDRVKQAAHGKGSPCAIQRSDREKQAAHKPLIEPP